MKIRILLSLFFITILTANSLYSQNKSIIIDHNCCNLTKVPDNWVNTTKNQFRIAYGHTSHGSQIVTGMSLLDALPNSLYTFNKSQGSLYLNDASILSGDLGNPDRTTWASNTRNVLNDNKSNINMIMWSWCGQVDGTESDISTYLTLMDQLEKEFPAVTFVYMTGHLNGTGVNGNVNKRNAQIRKFCNDNGKILFDFADIESYDPDGLYFLDKNADDGCNYTNANKSYNWADEWCANNPTLCNTDCSCAHSKCLNCQQKGKAFWWMMARVAGWEGVLTKIEDNYLIDRISFGISPNPSTEYISISFSNSELLNSSISIFNSLGIEIKRFEAKELSGQSIVNVSIEEYHAGVYFCRFRTDNFIKTKQFAIIR